MVKVKSNFNAFLKERIEKQNGLYEKDEIKRNKLKKVVYQRQKEWLHLFYSGGVFDPTGYNDDEFLHTIVKRFCYETFGVNLFAYDELKNDENFKELFDARKHPEEKYEKHVFKIHLLHEESKQINKLFEKENKDFTEKSNEVKLYFDNWRNMENEIWLERDGFGFYRLCFEYDENSGSYAYINKEEDHQHIVFKTLKKEKEYLKIFENFYSVEKNVLKRVVEETNKRLLSKNLDLIEPWEIGYLVKSDEFDYFTFSYKSQIIQTFCMKNSRLERLEGNIIYNTETLVREMYEKITEYMKSREDIDRKAYEHFLSTLSEKDVVKDDYIILKGKKFDYLILRRGGDKTNDFIRVEKGKPLESGYVSSLCIHPKETWVPRFDGFATMSMMIKAGKEEMLNKIANGHGINEISLNRVREIY
jgi:hypothetical protein